MMLAKDYAGGKKRMLSSFTYLFCFFAIMLQFSTVDNDY